MENDHGHGYAEAELVEGQGMRFEKFVHKREVHHAELEEEGKENGSHKQAVAEQALSVEKTVLAADGEDMAEL